MMATGPTSLALAMAVGSLGDVVVGAGVEARVDVSAAVEVGVSSPLKISTAPTTTATTTASTASASIHFVLGCFGALGIAALSGTHPGGYSPDEAGPCEESVILVLH